jgi:hypothetical protein
VERAALADAIRDEALRLGARLVSVSRLPNEPQPILRENGKVWRAAVDATGRSARWSRPVQVASRATATLYSGPGRPDARPGKIARLEQGGWAYRIEHPKVSTVGVVTTSARKGKLHPDLAHLLGMDSPTTFVAVAHRTAQAQWAKEPVQGRILAVGDAAFACEPLAGQGVRFALSSALAAASTLSGLYDGGANASNAADYYRNFVAGARSRHLQMLSHLRGGTSTGQLSPAFPGDTPVRFVATVCAATIHRDGLLVRGAAVQMADGGLVRWLGTYDLLELKELAGSALPITDILHRLVRANVSHAAAEMLVRWCLRQGILAPDPCIGNLKLPLELA